MLTILLRGVYIVVLARMLEPDAYGMLNFGISWYLTFIALTYLGLDIVLGREIGRGHKQVPVLVGSTFVLRTGVSAAVFALSIAIAFVAEPNPAARELLTVFSIALVGRAIWLWSVSVFSAFENTRHVFLLDLIFRPLEIIVLVLVLFLLPQKHLVAIAIAHTILWWIQGSVAVVIILRHVTPIDFRITWDQAKQLLMAGVPGALYTLALAWFMQGPIILYRQIIGSGENLGYFALSIQVIGYLVVIPLMAGSAALPVLSRSAANEDGTHRTIVLAILVLIPTVGLVLSALGMWLAPPLTALVFGANYREAGTLLSETIWLFMPFSLAIGLQQVVFARWISVTASLPAIIGGITMVVLFPPLTESLSYRGALLATGLGMAVWASGLVIFLIKNGIFARNGYRR